MKRRPVDERKPKICFAVIVKYIIMSIVFSFIIYGVDVTVLGAIDKSPIAQVGNSYITLYEVHNTGAAFNLFAGQQDAIIVASFLAVAALAFSVLVFSTRLTQSAISAISFLSAGITMNMLSRIEFGFVIDYVSINNSNFPVFNTADIMIVVGAIGLILSLFTFNER